MSFKLQNTHVMGAGQSGEGDDSAAVRAAAKGLCPHVFNMKKTSFRRMIRKKFLGEDAGGYIPRRKQEAPKITKESTAADYANALAMHTGKDSLLRAQTILHCQECAREGKGRSEEAIRRVKEKAAQSRIGTVCNLDLWLCMTCGEMACLGPGRSDHVLAHAQTSNHPLWIQCHDSHVFCVACERYVYPRELAGTSAYDRALDGIVYQWLLNLGRVRLWWRVFDTPCPTSSDVRGIKNFGNTCFFTSTCQALLHNKPLCTALRDSRGGGRPIQSELARLLATYTASSTRDHTLNPRHFFTAVQRNALFGQYSDNSMEDASSLLFDIFGGIDSKIVDELFGVRLASTITCATCDARRSELIAALGAVSKAAPGALATTLSNPRVLSLVVAYSVGAEPQPRNLPLETMLTLSLSGDKSSKDAKSPPKPSTTAGRKRKLVDLMSIHSRGVGDPALALRKLVENYFSVEAIPDYKCGSCGQRGGCCKRVYARSLPPVLVLQIKRFAPISTGVQIKCHRRVDVPMKLQLRGISPGEPTYRFSSMVVHDGGMGGGHNMCYTRVRRESLSGGDPAAADDYKRGAMAGDDDGKGWVWFSDRHLGPVSQREIDAAEPYIVFYERVSGVKGQ